MVSTSPDGSNYLPTLSHTLAATLAQVGQSLVALRGPRRHGVSGIHWRPGIIVAAELGRSPQADSKTLVLPNGNTATAAVVGRDPALDLVVLRVEQEELPTVTPSDLTQLQVGHLVVAAGRDVETGLSASLGIVSNLGGPWQTMQGRPIDALIRPDITLYPSLLGGALVDTQGQVIGINLTGPRRQVVTLPATTVDRVVDTLLETGQIRRGYLGVGLQSVELPASLQQTLELTDRAGLMVISLDPDGPAEQSGLLLGDIVITLNQQPVSQLNQVKTVLQPEFIGQTIPAQIIRGGQRLDLPLTVGCQP
ncbi:MAG: PDZ domain-containing protein [Leptolyngbyaceae cyanobacterium SM2_3_12]|nr:PDZ domain-containing protein [Leptolyngbyaceae cyanobacterium SM2_3_12]